MYSKYVLSYVSYLCWLQGELMLDMLQKLLEINEGCAATSPEDANSAHCVICIRPEICWYDGRFSSFCSLLLFFSIRELLLLPKTFWLVFGMFVSCGLSLDHWRHEWCLPQDRTCAGGPCSKRVEPCCHVLLQHHSPPSSSLARCLPSLLLLPVVIVLDLPQCWYKKIIMALSNTVVEHYKTDLKSMMLYKLPNGTLPATMHNWL